VKIADEAKITTKAVSGKTGTWLIDPVDYVIAPSGGDDTGKTISARLGDNSVTIILSSDLDEAGDLIVADSISWSSNNTTLTLQSNNNVFINAAISATGDSAGLVLRAVTGEVNINAPIEMGGSSSSLTITYGKDYNILTPASFSGTVIDEKTLKPVAKVDSRDDNDKVYGYVRLLGNNSTLKINDVDYNLLQNASDLEAIIMNNDSIRYGLVNNIQLDSTYGRNAIYSSATSEVFNGIFAGLGNTIFNLKINNTTTTQYTGLFQRIGNNGLIRDLGIKDAEIKASSSNVGILAGNNLGTIKNVYATGLIDLTSTNAVSSVGGLVGSLGANSTQANGFLINSSFTIVNIISTLTTSTGSYIGGLVGRQYGQTNNESVIQNSHTTGNIQVSDRKRLIGGLVGYASGTILNSYATGSVLASNDNAQYVGGLVGIYSLLASTSTSLTNSFATGSVTGKFDVGGLIGSFTGPQFQFTIDNCYAIGGDVTGNHENVGGLIGSLIGYSAVYQIFIKNSYSDKNILLTHNDPDNTYQSHGSVGGLIGYAAYAVINNSYSRGTITSSKPFEFKIGEYKNTSGEIVDLYGYNQNYGGLIGLANTSLISSSWSDVSVNTDADNVGGLVGQMSVTGTTQGRGIGYIVDSYARGEAKGANAIGGLVGGVSGGYINNSWASGNVIGSIKHAGGLIGYANTTSITDSYASGRVSGVNHVAGFVGGIYDTVITGSFFNVETTGQDNSVSDVVYTNNSYEISGLSNENFNDAEYVEALRNGTLQNLLDKREQEWQAEQDRIREEARLAQEAEETRLAEEARLAQEAEEARVAEEASVMAEFIQKTVITSDIGAKVINQQRELSFSPIKLSTNSITGAQELHPAKLETLISGNNFNSTIFTVPSIDSINFNAEIQGINVQSNYTNSISGSEKEPYEQNINIKEF
jgi:hypothetical protein